MSLTSPAMPRPYGALPASGDPTDDQPVQRAVLRRVGLEDQRAGVPVLVGPAQRRRPGLPRARGGGAGGDGPPVLRDESDRDVLVDAGDRAADRGAAADPRTLGR